eukprot:TRINITY_DN21384_c0_g1_i1.p1 TRINITY_DN21384_c0_g1~~TRINITY_DN21384_c0_g1_i1.p1  ORF type:complete len:347 (+),score=27.04 TRINITY_DN21384_c0_g1_i1:149-1042(+)
MRAVSMLYRTSLLAIVGAGASHSPRQLHLFNTHEDRNICDISFQDTVLSVKLNKKRLVVILEKCLHIFDLTRMAPLHIIDTESNPKGLGALSMCDEGSVVAYPKSVSPGCGDVTVVDAITAKSIHVIRAHKTLLAALTISNCGTKLATASQKGTVIRVFSISPQGKSEAPLLYALRRGSSPATVYSLSFNVTASLLVCTSNKSTIHIWRCDSASVDGSTGADGPGTVGDTMRNMYQAERSWAQFQSPAANTSNVVALSKDSKRVFVATMDGHLYIHSLDLATGECKREAEYVLAGND